MEGAYSMGTFFFNACASQEKLFATTKNVDKLLMATSTGVRNVNDV